ncbi:hypothetical protein HGB13_00200 [bacterium]|nr:hypothetical protein [bacterium]
MFHNNRSESIAPAKGSEKVGEVKKELEVLGEVKSQYEASIENSKKLASDYEGLEAKVLDKKAELEFVSSQVDKISNLLDVSNKEIKELETKKENYNAVLSELESIIKLRDQNKKSFESEKDSYNKEIEGLVKEQLKIREGINYTSIELTSLTENRKKLQGYIQEEDATLSSLKLKSEKASKELSEINKDIEFGKNKLKELSDKFASEKEIKTKELETLISTKKEEAEKIMSDASDYSEGLNKTLVAREGEVSNKEKFLLVRENFLRDVKTQLEDKLGKKIDIINF